MKMNNINEDEQHVPKDFICELSKEQIVQALSSLRVFHCRLKYLRSHLYSLLKCCGYFTSHPRSFVTDEASKHLQTRKTSSVFGLQMEPLFTLFSQVENDRTNCFSLHCAKLLWCNFFLYNFTAYDRNVTTLVIQLVLLSFGVCFVTIFKRSWMIFYCHDMILAFTKECEYLNKKFVLFFFFFLS